MLAGLSRLIEICFIIPAAEKDNAATDSDSHSERTLSSPSTENARLTAVQAFRHLPPFLLVAAGLLFMSATDEELESANDSGMDHVTYTLIMLSLAFTIYTFVLTLINMWGSTGRNASGSASGSRTARASEDEEEAKWYTRVPDADAEPISSPFVIGE